MRVENLHQSRNCTPHRLPIAGVEVCAQAKVVVDGLGEIVFSQVAECFSQVVDHKAVAVSEVFVAHLRHLPPR